MGTYCQAYWPRLEGKEDPEEEIKWVSAWFAEEE